MVEAAGRAVELVEAASQNWSASEEEAHPSLPPPPPAAPAIEAAASPARTVEEVVVELAPEQKTGANSFP